MLKETKSNYYVKELNKIEQYIVRIFKRYFDIEELNNAGTIDFIIQESIKRYKESINYERSGVDALNNKTGVVNVNIHDFGGEPAFDKKTAFNKDFGQIEDTVCEGNDPRLTDRREPTEHNHLIKHINSLEEILKELKIEAGKYLKHLHTNLEVLDKIIYNGSRETIDLIELEQLIPKITPLLQELVIKRHELINEFETKEKIIRDMIKEPENIKKYIDELDAILKKAIEKKIPELVSAFLKEAKEKIKPYPDVELLNKIKPVANNNSLYAAAQYFNIADMLEETVTDVSSDNGESMIKMYDGSNAIAISGTTVTYLTETQKVNRWTFDDTVNSFVCSVNLSKHLIFLSSSKYIKYTHEVTLTSTDDDNDLISVILASTEPDNNGRIYPLSLNITAGLSGVTNTDHNFNVMIGYGYSKTNYKKEIAYDPTFTDNNFSKEWNNKKIRVKIERDGTVFKIYRSEVNSETLNTTPCIEFDIAKDSDYGSYFTEPSAYGYGCYSQEYSQFLDVQFSGYTVSTAITSDPKIIPIDYSLVDQEKYNIDNVEIQPELLYNNSITKIPYITEDFIIDSGITSDKNIYIKIQKLKEDAELPQEIIEGKIRYSLYAQRNLI